MHPGFHLAHLTVGSFQFWTLSSGYARTDWGRGLGDSTSCRIQAAHSRLCSAAHIPGALSQVRGQYFPSHHQEPALSRLEVLNVEPITYQEGGERGVRWATDMDQADNHLLLFRWRGSRKTKPQGPNSFSHPLGTVIWDSHLLEMSYFALDLSSGHSEKRKASHLYVSGFFWVTGNAQGFARNIQCLSGKAWKLTCRKDPTTNVIDVNLPHSKLWGSDRHRCPFLPIRPFPREIMLF